MTCPTIFSKNTGGRDEFTEIAYSGFGRRHTGRKSIGGRVPLAEKVHEEERLVLDDRPAKRAAEFIHANAGLGHVFFGLGRAHSVVDFIVAEHADSPVGRIQGVVLPVVKGGTVKAIGAGLVGGIDGGAAPPHLGLGNTRIHFELGDGVGVGKDADGAELRFVVVHTVEREVVCRRAQAIHGERRAARAAEARGFRGALFVGLPRDVAPANPLVALV